MENAARTSTADDGDSEPIEMYLSEDLDIPEVIPVDFKDIVRDEDRLNELDNVDAIDEVFRELCVIWKCQIV